MRYKEIESNYEMSQKTPPLSMNIMLLKNARDVYTPTIFRLVCGEYEKPCNLVVNKCTQKLHLYEYEVSLFGDMREHKVTFSSEDQSIECSCQLFQFIGILCCHALQVLNHLNIIVIPPKYILKRWTRDARSGCVINSKGQIIKEDPRLDVSNRFKDLCRVAVEISSKAVECVDASTYLSKKLMVVAIGVDSIINKRTFPPSDCQTTEYRQDDTSIISNKNGDASQIKGIKKKDGVSRLKGGPKSCLEKKSRRAKGT
ncbi:protein FAR1-RELATED SEQUENCE 9-like [Vicia villosa]|uniref:protein FAR1-RELATED SEQUENCE 9-like n=1 Tax=Vicia villosa TaxID=3911 RepID=UPI00273C26C5|nr:protein FAR1-RELATED SEQUENCE 9-like [Vicia villosa]